MRTNAYLLASSYQHSHRRYSDLLPPMLCLSGRVDRREDNGRGDFSYPLYDGDGMAASDGGASGIGGGRWGWGEGEE